jgi:thiol:disulfide interchange protein DsbD
MTANLLLLAFLLWVYGQLQTSGRAWLSRAGGVAILAVAAAGLNWIDLDRAVASDAIVHDEASGWQPYSEEAVAAALATGRPAFVDFTADWCITCQVNERTVLARPRVLEAFQRADVALFVADWTRRDEGIRRKLAEFGRAGVPLYLVYAPEDPSRPRVLSELLSQAEVIAAIEAPRATATARASAEPR